MHLEPAPASTHATAGFVAAVVSSRVVSTDRGEQAQARQVVASQPARGGGPWLLPRCGARWRRRAPLETA